MRKVYDNIRNSLRVSYRDVLIFDLILRPHITQIYGDTATGKSLLVDCLKTEKSNYKNNAMAKYDTSSVMVYEDEVTVSELKDYKGFLIVIDRADLYLKEDTIKYIASDTRNQYLIMSRTSLPFGISPNYYGQLINRDGVISIEYDYSIKGWF